MPPWPTPRRLITDASWPWPGWLAGGALTSLAADPGIGKTLLAMTLARTLWMGGPWPDGQANPMPAQTRTLWVPGDHHYPQLLDLAGQYGLPDEAVVLNATRDAPTGGHDLDDTAVLEALGQAHRHLVARPGDHRHGPDDDRPQPGQARGRPRVLRPADDDRQPEQDGVPALDPPVEGGPGAGRRIVGASRVVWKLTHPDPEGQPDRRRLWVDKSYAVKPPPLGMIIAAEGCQFDAQPPEEPAKDQGGRPGHKLGMCRLWLKGLLDVKPMLVKDIRSEADAMEFSAKMLYRAGELLNVEEYTIDKRKWWKLPAAS